MAVAVAVAMATASPVGKNRSNAKYNTKHE